MINLRAYEVGGTVTQGVQIYCSYCSSWFADWTSRDPYPSLRALMSVAEEHERVCDVDPDERQRADWEIEQAYAVREV